MIIEWMLLATIAAGQVAPAPAPGPAPQTPSPPQVPAPAPTPAPADGTAPSTGSPQTSPATASSPEVGVLDPDYKPYGEHDVAAALGTKTGKDGRTHHVLVMQVVDGISADLAAHALQYPPAFRSPEERARAETDVQRLAGVLDIATKRDPAQKDDAPSELLLKLAMLQSIANNLDIQGSADQAIATFERLLAREPEHRWANYHYGVFLAGTASLQDKAEPYLKKALALGIDEAHYSLGLLHFAQGDTPAALQDLDAWLKLHPDDERGKAMVEAVKSGQLQRHVIKR